jgi:hypothetical protein
MSDERELKQLYQAMRSEDAQHVPSFARVVALTRPTAANLGYLRAVAITFALVLVAVLVSVNALRRRELPPQVAQTPAPAIVHVAAGDHARPAAESAASTQAKAPQPAARRKLHAAPSIDDWKSPTAAWLQTPDESFRNTLPSLESSVKLSD